MRTRIEQWEVERRVNKVKREATTELNEFRNTDMWEAVFLKGVPKDEKGLPISRASII